MSHSNRPGYDFDNKNPKRGGTRGHPSGRYRSRQPDPFVEEQNDNYVPNWDEIVPSFEDMNLDANLLAGLYAYGFKSPSRIQQLAVKPIQLGRNVIAQAQSGTGKTCAFGVGILSRIDFSSQTTQALIITPTRELTQQNYTVIKDFGSRIEELTISLHRGGQELSEDQNSAIANPHIAVCTPGRALHLIQEGNLRCENLKVVCLDEADKLLEGNLLEQIRQIFSYLPGESVQFLSFSATIPVSSFSIMEQFMSNPVQIFVPKEQLTLEGIKQYYVNAEKSEHKWATLLDIYGTISINRAIIFANARQTVDRLVEEFTGQGFGVSSLHGAMELTDRDGIMKRFRTGEVRVLITTDVLARGIDVQQVTLVINFELPKDHSTYIHRIGRGGRHGRGGVAINICDNQDMFTINKLKEFYNTTIEEMPQGIAEIINATERDST